MLPATKITERKSRIKPNDVAVAMIVAVFGGAWWEVLAAVDLSALLLWYCGVLLLRRIGYPMVSLQGGVMEMINTNLCFW